MPTSVQHHVERFLAGGRIAVVGVSRNPKHYSRMVWEELRGRGYDLVAVNPNVAEIDFAPVAPRLTEVRPPARAALLLTPPEEVERAAADCIAAGVDHVWIRQPAKPGSPERRAAEKLREQGIPVLTGVCPFMVLPDTALFHRIHAFIARLTNTVGEAHEPRGDATQQT